MLKSYAGNYGLKLISIIVMLEKVCLLVRLATNDHCLPSLRESVEGVRPWILADANAGSGPSPKGVRSLVIGHVDAEVAFRSSCPEHLKIEAIGL